MPAGAVYVGRPTKWGNPFTMADPKNPRERERVVDQYELWLKNEQDGKRVAREARGELRGKDLACWCPVTTPTGKRVPCHADALLTVANAGKRP